MGRVPLNLVIFRTSFRLRYDSINSLSTYMELLVESFFGVVIFKGVKFFGRGVLVVGVFKT